MPLNDIFRRTIDMFRLTMLSKNKIMGSMMSGYFPGPVSKYRVFDRDQLDLMHLCVKMSTKAYDDQWRIERFLHSRRLRLIKWNMASDVNLPAFFIAEDMNDMTLYIAIRGTQHVNDVFTSFQTNVTRLRVHHRKLASDQRRAQSFQPRSPSPQHRSKSIGWGQSKTEKKGAIKSSPRDVLVHAGFLHSAKCILEKEIAPLLLARPNRDIILTGHSLGGAVATLLTILLTSTQINTRDGKSNSRYKEEMAGGGTGHETGNATFYPYRSLKAVTFGAPPSIAADLYLPELSSISMDGDLVPRLSMQNARLIRDFYLNWSCTSDHFEKPPSPDSLLVPGTIYWIYPGGNGNSLVNKYRRNEEAFVRVVDQAEHNRLVLGWHIFEHHTLSVYQKNLGGLRDSIYKEMYPLKAEHERPDTKSIKPFLRAIRSEGKKSPRNKKNDRMRFKMNILGCEYGYDL
eukprot:CAMPEP_0185259556 /NCGR_PEP_ID=MMETSP1359-20130426/8309_1 /TAXON_ID=552665 /ORGANISM="Bigelowiella longifila, Strain CCMP242" /LENGTH=456 /DNA_ID=CAMNT_0027845499 /DNA_START=132 /DNA_END=1502 /DNA_ORIENTATION=+